MKGKYFCVDKNGRVLISKKELDEALNDAYNEGYQAGKNSIYWWPYAPQSYEVTWDSITDTISTANIDLNRDNITIKC